MGRLIVARGDDRHRGRVIGRQMREGIISIRRSLDAFDRTKGLPTLRSWVPAAEKLADYIRVHSPRTLVEMEGMAEGANLAASMHRLIFSRPMGASL